MQKKIESFIVFCLESLEMKPIFPPLANDFIFPQVASYIAKKYEPEIVKFIRFTSENTEYLKTENLNVHLSDFATAVYPDTASSFEVTDNLKENLERLLNAVDFTKITTLVNPELLTSISSSMLQDLSEEKSKKIVGNLYVTLTDLICDMAGDDDSDEDF